VGRKKAGRNLTKDGNFCIPLLSCLQQEKEHVLHKAIVFHNISLFVVLIYNHFILMC